MRQFEKENLLKIVRGITGVHSAIGGCLARGDKENALALLAECQNSAIRLGELIEKLDNSAGATVEKLEAYCEQAFRIAECISDESNAKKIIKKLDRSLTAAENSISNDIRTQLEVVFLPYEASMWDSMESVWMAARDDPDCDAYVIPIPYYDRNPDMSFGQFHYEGELFPADVPITHYEKYDFEQRRPDIVFIHNAYDENNFVTSVDPRFYSYELKKFTPILMYIDYGIPIWVPRDMVDYGTIPIVFFRVDYIACYCKGHADCSNYTIRLRQKDSRACAVSLGSPKFDKVLHDSRENHTLPEEIQRKLAGRKSVLLNTSIGAFLTDTGEYLERLEHVLKILQGTDGIIPWWRPHPLLRATAKSMRPQFMERYDAIVASYQENGCGIYDESEDVHRAIQWTDAYYGDESSLVFLYCATGKPLTIRKFHTSDFLLENTERFDKALDYRIRNMKTARGGNILNRNTCVFWPTFWESPDYIKHLRLYLDFILNPQEYPQAQEYREQQLRLFREAVANPDGTAGEKIYQFGKDKFIKEHG